MEEEIKAEFTKNGFNFDNEEEILQKCLTFCIEYNLSASDLVSSWEVYSLNRDLELTVQSKHMGGFLDQLQREKLNKIKEEHSKLHMYSNDVEMILDGDYEDMEVLSDTSADRPTPGNDKQYDSAQKTKGSRSRLTSEKPLESVTPFATRKNKFVVQSTLNNHVSAHAIKIEEDPVNAEDDIIKRVQPSEKCSMMINQTRPEPGCRFMYNRIEDTLDFLENRIKSRAAAFASSGLYGEPVDPSVACQKSIFAVGMICCEEEGRLKEKPIMLQSSIEHSGGQRVRLDLQNLDQFSIFPGQVVGVEGHNPSGHCLIASKIIDCVPLSDTLNEESPAKRQAMDQNLQIVNPSESELSLIVAAGPFTTRDNLLFEPLTELLAYARRKQPQLLVLTGPFIDSNHPQLNKGMVNQTFDEMFQTEILEKLQDYVEYMGPSVQVILMPSIRDANNDLVFPQARFDVRPSDFNNQIHSVTNPGNFCANEVKVACCSVDVLKQLSAEEINRKQQGGRLINLAKHILNQYSFYPLYPPAEDVPLDYSLAPETLNISSTPDILVLPSDLAQFVTIISIGDGNEGQEQRKCICVNPGRLARGEGGGFFSEINFKGNPDSSNASIIRI